VIVVDYDDVIVEDLDKDEGDKKDADDKKVVDVVKIDDSLERVVDNIVNLSKD